MAGSRRGTASTTEAADEAAEAAPVAPSEAEGAPSGGATGAGASEAAVSGAGGPAGDAGAPDTTVRRYKALRPMAGARQGGTFDATEGDPRVKSGLAVLVDDLKGPEVPDEVAAAFADAKG